MQTPVESSIGIQVLVRSRRALMNVAMCYWEHQLAATASIAASFGLFSKILTPAPTGGSLCDHRNSLVEKT
ncbi:hypothetical protein B7486_36660 [cyanobacterium TDX16]|nr:hypothetical protein B7486_36660 [cyanobacterium TDX16]